MDQVSIGVSAGAAVEADVLGVPVVEGDGAPRAAQFDERLTARLRRLSEQGDLASELGKTLLLYEGDQTAPRGGAVGVGPEGEVDADALRTAAAAVARATSEIGGTLAWALDDGLAVPLADQARAVVEGVALGSY